ncbi:MAG: DNA repair protein RecN [Thermodesulfobacteriota bacterium]
MLVDLRLENLAIIDKLEVSFAPGFNVLTGETGAGKSIIVDAVSLLLGGRAGSEIVRTGAEGAVLEGLFQLAPSGPVMDILRQSGCEADDCLIIRRRVSRAGRSRFYLNGNLVPQSLVESLSPLLVNVCGQHQNQVLLTRERHLDILDAFAGLGETKRMFASLYAEWNEVRETLKRLSQGGEEVEREAGLLRSQLTEIEAAKLTAGEEEELKERWKLVANAQKLYTLCAEGLDYLYSANGSALEDLSRVREKLVKIAELDVSFIAVREKLASLEAELSETASLLREYLGKIDLDPAELERVELRLDLLARLKRKYEKDVPGLIGYLEQLKSQLEEVESSEIRLEKLTRQEKELSTRLRQEALALSKQRLAAAQRMCQALVTELGQLGMENSSFHLGRLAAEDLDACRSPIRPHGLDEVEFFFSSNPGEEPKPLMRTASGGELSRITLALKTISTEIETPPTLIFDEVDAGLGGAVSEIIGQRLREISNQGCQILCVTHLAQIARFADRHFLVEKGQAQGRTVARMQLVQGEDRVKEISRMLAGMEVTPATRRHARQLLAGE